jgi:hypothetical protein
MTGSLDIRELTGYEKLRLWWGFFWRGMCITLGKKDSFIFWQNDNGKLTPLRLAALAKDDCRKYGSTMIRTNPKSSGILNTKDLSSPPISWSPIGYIRIMRVSSLRRLKVMKSALGRL